MKKQKIFALFLCLALLLQLFALCVCAAEADEPDDADEPEAPIAEEPVPDDPTPTLACKGAILVELNSDTVVYERNADERLYPASLTKIMTCLLALEHGTLSDEVTVDGSLIEGMDPDASTAGLLDGETMTLEDLLYCVMVPSANDASVVVADHIAGSVDAFVEMMNDKAQLLGCTGTHFVNPDGLHDDDHYTTARDMALITRAALQSETFRTICGTAVHELPATNLSPSKVVYTTNYFMSTIITSDYYWEEVSGVKTGFTTPAGRCLVSLVERGPFSYLSVVLGAGTEYGEHGEPIYGSFTESHKLLQYGLDEFSFVSVLSHLNPIAQVGVSSGKVKSVVIAPVEDVNALLPNEFSDEKLQISYQLDSGDTLIAPLEADQIVGTATVTYAGKVVGQARVRTIAAVERNMISVPTADDPGILKLVLILAAAAAIVVLVLSLIRRVANQSRRKRR